MLSYQAFLPQHHFHRLVHHKVRNDFVTSSRAAFASFSLFDHRPWFWDPHRRELPRQLRGRFRSPVYLRIKVVRIIRDGLASGIERPARPNFRFDPLPSFLIIKSVLDRFSIIF
jgi:hypothetical protein